MLNKRSTEKGVQSIFSPPYFHQITLPEILKSVVLPHKLLRLSLNTTDVNFKLDGVHSNRKIKYYSGSVTLSSSTELLNFNVDNSALTE